MILRLALRGFKSLFWLWVKIDIFHWRKRFRHVMHGVASCCRAFESKLQILFQHGRIHRRVKKNICHAITLMGAKAAIFLN